MGFGPQINMDNMVSRNNMFFSTKDKDNDLSSESCSTFVAADSGWWFSNAWTQISMVFMVA